MELLKHNKLGEWEEGRSVKKTKIIQASNLSAFLWQSISVYPEIAFENGKF